MLKILIGPIFILFCVTTSGMTQNKQGIDSLQVLLKSETNDTTRVELLIEISRNIGLSDSALTISYVEKAIKLAKEIGYDKGRIDAQFEIGALAMRMGHHKIAELYFEKVALESDKANYLKGKSNGYNGLGAINDVNGNYPVALQYFQLSLEIEKILDDQEAIANLYSNIGYVYESQDDYEESLIYYSKSLIIYQSLEDELSLAHIDIIIGENYFQQKKYQKALEYFESSRAHYKALGRKNYEAYCLQSIGSAYRELGQYNKAEDFYLRSIKIYDQIGGQFFFTYPIIGLGINYYKQEKFNAAKNYLERGVKISEEFDHLRNLRVGLEYLAKVNEALGNYKEAYLQHVRYKTLEDSLINEKQTKKLTRVESEYAFKQERDSINHVQEKAQLSYEKELTRQRYIKIAVAGVAFSFAIIALLIFRSYRIKQLKNQELHNRNEIIDLKNQELTNRNNEISELRVTEKELAEETLALKERELTTVTMHSHEKNTILQHLGEQIAHLGSKVNEKLLPDLKEIKNTIKANLNDESWSKFTYQFEKVHPKFFNDLKNAYEALTPNDLRLCAFIKVGMGNKEIAQVSNITIAGVKKSVNRLKKKVNLSAESDLREFLMRY